MRRIIDVYYLESIVILKFLLIVSAISLFEDKFFTTDSWTYLDLSERIFHQPFYTILNQRSYIHFPYSSSFPFGFPILLSLLGAFLTPIISYILLVYFLFKYLQILKIETSQLFILFTILLSLPSLTDELIQVRSIPITLAFYFMGLFLFERRQIVLSGILFGLTAVFRFDFLIVSVLTLIYLIYNFNNGRFKLISFFILGLMPWILYSFIRFNTFWISDNSWILLSVDREAFVKDFYSNMNEIRTIFSHPTLWVTKVLYNLKTLFFKIPTIELFQFIFLTVISFTVLKRDFIYRLWREFSLSGFLKDRKRTLYLILFLISFTPYLGTGYYDSRYFILQTIIIVSFILKRKVSKDLLAENIRFIKLGLFSLFLILNGLFFSRYGYLFYRDSNSFTEEDQFIRDLNNHILNNRVSGIITPIFSSCRLGAKYSAITGSPSACLPSNFDKLVSEDKTLYFEKFDNYLIIPEDYNNLSILE